jgi:hypothetical protein
MPTCDVGNERKLPRFFVEERTKLDRVANDWFRFLFPKTKKEGKNETHKQHLIN